VDQSEATLVVGLSLSSLSARISDFGFTHTPSQPLMKIVAMRELLHCLLGSFAVSYICYVHISAVNMRFS
jgi:hypothetical protein